MHKLPAENTQRRHLVDYLVRVRKPVSIKEFKKKIKSGEIPSERQMTSNITTLLCSMAMGYKVCKMENPLLVVRKDEVKGKLINTYVLRSHVTDKWIAEQGRLQEIAKRDLLLKKSKKIKVIQPNGDVTVGTNKGNVLVKRDGKEIASFVCTSCKALCRDINDAEFRAGIGWVCDECLDDE